MFLKIAGLILAGYTAVFGLFAVVALRSGIAVVHVSDHRSGESVWIPVPLVLGNVGLALLPDRALADVRRELGPHRKSVEAVIDVLRDCPDGPFVEVEGRREHVRIEKRGDNLVVDVESRDQDVYVKLPLRGTRQILAQLSAQ